MKYVVLFLVLVHAAPASAMIGNCFGGRGIAPGGCFPRQNRPSPLRIYLQKAARDANMSYETVLKKAKTVLTDFWESQVDEGVSSEWQNAPVNYMLKKLDEVNFPALIVRVEQEKESAKKQEAIAKAEELLRSKQCGEAMGQVSFKFKDLPKSHPLRTSIDNNDELEGILDTLAVLNDDYGPAISLGAKKIVIKNGRLERNVSTQVLQLEHEKRAREYLVDRFKPDADSEEALKADLKTRRFETTVNRSGDVKKLFKVDGELVSDIVRVAYNEGTYKALPNAEAKADVRALGKILAGLVKTIGLDADNSLVLSSRVKDFRARKNDDEEREREFVVTSFINLETLEALQIFLSGK